MRPFAFAPDVVLLVTGSTNGLLEACNCSGPMPGGLARRSGLLRSYRAACEYTLTIDTGDLFWIEPGDLRNNYSLRGYGLLGYDAVVLGDQEWAESDDRLAAMLSGELAPVGLSTTVQSPGSAESLPIRRELLRPLGEHRIALLSYVGEEAFAFFDRARAEMLRRDSLASLAGRIEALRADGATVVLVVHGSEDDVRAAAKLRPDVILWGHAAKSCKELLAFDAVPVVRVGQAAYVGVLALALDPGGRVSRSEYRLEVVDEAWPIDHRLLELYQAYAHQAMRRALDAKREQSIAFATSESCGQCHQAQYRNWKGSAHAGAYRTLQRVDRTGDPNCLTCHTLGFGMEGGFYTFRRTPERAGVHCQNCHRFGTAEHLSAEGRAGLRHQGLAPVTEEVCTSCHTPVTDPNWPARKARRFHDLGCGRAFTPATRPAR